MIRRILKSFNDGTYLVEYEDRDSAVLSLDEGQVQALNLREDLARMFPHLEFEIEDDLLLWHGGDIHCTAERENALKTIALAEFHFCNDYDYFYKNYFKPKTETKC